MSPQRFQAITCLALEGTALGLPDATPGSPDLTPMGVLTLKGVSHPLAFTGCTGLTPEGKPAAQARPAFDRTLWNVRYGSGKWFRHPGGHLANDLMELQLPSSEPDSRPLKEWRAAVGRLAAERMRRGVFPTGRADIHPGRLPSRQ